MGDGPCCCGKLLISEPLQINDYLHEPLGSSGNFCGPVYKHPIRDQADEIERLRVELMNMTELQRLTRLELVAAART